METSTRAVFAVMLLGASFARADDQFERQLERRRQEEEFRREQANDNQRWQQLKDANAAATKLKIDYENQRLKNAKDQAAALLRQHEQSQRNPAPRASGCTSRAWSGGLEAHNNTSSPHQIRAFVEMGATEVPHPRLVGFELTNPPDKRVRLTTDSMYSCRTCAFILEWCGRTQAGYSCGKRFLATDGTATFEFSTPQGPTGRVSAKVENAHFVEWDERTDRPIPGGECIDLPEYHLSVGFPQVAPGAPPPPRPR